MRWLSSSRILPVLLLALLAGGADATEWAEREGEETYVRYCSTCHPPSVPLRRDKRCSEWRQTVDRMASLRERLLGEGIPEEERVTIARFLGRTVPER